MSSDVVIPAITGATVKAVVGNTLLNIENGGATSEDIQGVAKLADSWCKIVQTQLNCVKMEIECKKNGHSFGRSMKRAKAIFDQGYIGDENADD